MRIAMWIGGIFISLFYGISLILQLIWTTPRKGQPWVSEVVSPGTIKADTNSIVIAVVGMVVDLYLMLIPLHAVMNLNLPKLRKIGVAMVFLTGILFEIQNEVANHC